MKKQLLTILLLLTPFAQAADYFLPDVECDNHVNVRAAPNTKSKILAALDFRSPIYRIIGKHGSWYRIQMGKQTGYVHKSQGYITHRYQVVSKDGFANVRSMSNWTGDIARREIIRQLPSGKTIFLDNRFRKGDWWVYRNQGDVQDSEDAVEGYSQKPA